MIFTASRFSFRVTAMREAAAADNRPYHHGDLRRALIDAAQRLLESEGPTALSLRAVAREAGVSPAAPYHHFKDKSDLLEAVAHGVSIIDLARPMVVGMPQSPNHPEFANAGSNRV